MAAKSEIKRLIVNEGLSNQEIISRLKIPQRTLERYIAELNLINSDGAVAAADMLTTLRERVKELEKRANL